MAVSPHCRIALAFGVAGRGRDDARRPFDPDNVYGKLGPLPGETVIGQRQGDALGDPVATHPAGAEVPIRSFNPTIVGHPRLATFRRIGCILEQLKIVSVQGPSQSRVISRQRVDGIQ
ncbi:hypothetical protein [Mesorhizobium sp. CA12]|uniref:hypothetical protein n=1 Tax=Mesorhizobium sp. CA12 TaxID=2876644 RepID=UPI001CCF3FF4|nr:hypothetical protein [Mesorhizobium sp. CA12]MBZ9860652.1 hypothetical protein [Mesorhizobium sp. CA12]